MFFSSLVRLLHYLFNTWHTEMLNQVDSRYRQTKFFMCVAVTRSLSGQNCTELLFYSSKYFFRLKKSPWVLKNMAKFHHNSRIILKVCIPLLQAFFLHQRMVWDFTCRFLFRIQCKIGRKYGGPRDQVWTFRY